MLYILEEIINITVARELSTYQIDYSDGGQCFYMSFDCRSYNENFLAEAVELFLYPKYESVIVYSKTNHLTYDGSQIYQKLFWWGHGTAHKNEALRCFFKKYQEHISILGNYSILNKNWYLIKPVPEDIRNFKP